uniref:Uncharacterized protein n=1 Tax=Arundo donax TaxID=35708 RepID=A0A0A9BHQ4_ARUDO
MHGFHCPAIFATPFAQTVWFAHLASFRKSAASGHSTPSAHCI